MRHMLIVGKYNALVGHANEVAQLAYSPSSAMDPQDVYANRLGYKFHKCSEGKGLMGSIMKLIHDPTEFSNRVGRFLKNPVYRGNKIFIDR